MDYDASADGPARRAPRLGAGQEEYDPMSYDTNMNAEMSYGPDTKPVPGTKPVPAKPAEETEESEETEETEEIPEEPAERARPDYVAPTFDCEEAAASCDEYWKG